MTAETPYISDQAPQNKPEAPSADNTPPVEIAQKHSKKELKQFSKSTESGRNERATTAQKVVDTRKNLGKHIEARETIRTRTADIELKTNAIQAERRDIMQSITSLKQQLERRQRNIFYNMKDALFPSGRASLEKKITKAEEEKEVLDNNLQDATVDVMRLQLQQESLLRRRIQSPHAILASFYEDQDEKLTTEKRRQAYEEKAAQEIQALEEYKNVNGSVEQALETYDTYVLHGLSSLTEGNLNSVLRDGVTWKDRLAIDVTIAPPLACRGIKKRNS